MATAKANGISSDQLMIDICCRRRFDWRWLLGMAPFATSAPQNVVQAIRYGIELVGVDHVALGSDYDGSVATSFDSSELAILTETMLQSGFSEEEIRKVMGRKHGSVFTPELTRQLKREKHYTWYWQVNVLI